jgi:16S rRNA (guanine527-N7)-methyltransferase
MSVPRETHDSAVELFGPGLAKATAYAEALATTGAERGLIGPREVPRLWDRHLLNCVALKELIPDGAELADVGSGAGLPGLPLSIARPDLSVFLIEPLLRRVVWLREIVLELDLPNVEIIRARANAVAETRSSFDVVTARAVAPLPSLLELCLPLVRPGGELLAMKGDSAAEELIEAQPILERLGAVGWSVATCGEGVLETPTTVVRVTAGRQKADVRSTSRSKKAGSANRPAYSKPKRPASSGRRRTPEH